MDVLDDYKLEFLDDYKFYDRDPLPRAPKIIGTEKQGFNLRHRLDRLLPQGHRLRGYEKVE